MDSEQKRDPLDHLAIALDTSEWSTFENWCEQFGPRVGVLKVGLEAFVRWGPKAVELARVTLEEGTQLRLSDFVDRLELMGYERRPSTCRFGPVGKPRGH